VIKLNVVISVRPGKTAGKVQQQLLELTAVVKKQRMITSPDMLLHLRGASAEQWRADQLLVPLLQVATLVLLQQLQPDTFTSLAV
jgi:hypothetical protein